MLTLLPIMLGAIWSQVPNSEPPAPDANSAIVTTPLRASIVPVLARAYLYQLLYCD